MKRAFWTPEDDAMLREGFDTMSFADLCRALDRQPTAIGLRAGKLGLGEQPAAHALTQAFWGAVPSETVQ